jgi:hypothetical protein
MGIRPQSRDLRLYFLRPEQLRGSEHCTETFGICFEEADAVVIRIVR